MKQWSAESDSYLYKKRLQEKFTAKDYWLLWSTERMDTEAMKDEIDALTKKIVKRGVTELVTPGVSYNDKVLSGSENNFLAAIHFEGKKAGVSFLDVSTGEFLVAEGHFEYIDKLIQSFNPKEILFQKGKQKLYLEHFSDKFYTYKLED